LVAQFLMIAVVTVGCLAYLFLARPAPWVAVIVIIVFALALGGLMAIWFFQWKPLLRAAHSAREASGADAAFCFSAVAISPPSGAPTVTHGPGWLLCSPSGISVQEAGSFWAAYQGSREVSKLLWSEINSVTTLRVAHGRAYSRLVVTAAGNRVDAALISPSGRSLVGISDAEVARVAAEVLHSAP
jgi:hypothetical protein